MSSAAVIGIGTKFQRNGITIAEVVSIALAGNTRAAIDVTSFDSANSAKEFIAGMVDGAKVNANLNFLPQNATQRWLATDLQNNGSTTIPQNWRIIWPDAANTIWSFVAIVTDVSPIAKVDDKLNATVSLKITQSLSIV